MRPSLYFIAVMAVLGACQTSPPAASEQAKELAQPVALGKTEKNRVETIQIQPRPFVYRLRLLGKVRAERSIELSFRQSGFLEKLLVKNAQTVKKGQLIAQLEPSEAQINLQEAHTQVAMRQSDYQDRLVQHKFDLQNAEEISPELRQQFAISSGLRAAELQLERAKLQLQQMQLIAPFAGKIADCKLQKGQNIEAGKAYALLYSHQSLYLDTEVLESELAQLKLGQKAHVFPFAHQETALSAQLERINPKIDDKGKVKIELKLAYNPKLMPGMNAHAELEIPTRQCLIVPKVAIVRRSGRDVVFTEVKGKAYWNYVKLGLDNGQEVEILEGLKSGDRVIVSNNLQLDHDAPLEIVKNQ